MSAILGTAVTGAGGGAYTVNNSLRFRSSASAYLNRTPSSAGNRKTWTWSAWVKRGAISHGSLFQTLQDSTNSNYTRIQLDNDHKLAVIQVGTGTFDVTTTQVFRDPSAYYHLLVSVDTTQATNTNRVRVFVNGAQVSSFAVATYPSQNADTFINSTNRHLTGIAEFGGGGSFSIPFDGYMTEVNFIDGQALTPSSFGETNASTGVWQPKAYAGSYGTNGFYLKFSSIATTSGSNTGLGRDFSGNGNFWNTNNISVTPGVTYDAMTDSPTPASSTVGNYCVWNAADRSFMAGGSRTISNGNLTAADASNSFGLFAKGTIFVSSGKWYWEYNCTNIGGTTASAGVVLDTTNTGIFYQSNGNRSPSADYTGTTAYGASYTTGDVIGVALDMDAGSVTFYKNNVSQGVVTGLSGSYSAGVGDSANATQATFDANFGQRPFVYTPPSGFNRLQTYNLPTPTIGASATTLANEYFDATIYTANGSAPLSVVNAGGFRPDFVWTKSRANSLDNQLYDSTRGVTNVLISNSTAAAANTANTLTSFNSNGYTVGTSDWSNHIGGSGSVGWQWRANGGSTVSNTSGSITSTVQANTTSGFSIVTYTGTGSGATVGHGLGVAPRVMFIKSRGEAVSWAVYHNSLGATRYLVLNTTAAGTISTAYWNYTNPSSTVFTLGVSTSVNKSGISYVAYCFAPVQGFSSFGSYTGNGSADGPFIYTGFRPRWILIKPASLALGWSVWDTARGTFNTDDKILQPNLPNAEAASTLFLDILSNGFKIRNTPGEFNTSGSLYLYMAFAETPFNYSLAR